MPKEMDNNTSSFLQKRTNSFICAFRGIAQAFRSELHMKIHCLAAVCVIILGLFTGLTTTEWFMVSLAITLVLITEMLNTALEKLVDLTHPEQHDLAGQVKDIAAGAVLIAAGFALAVAWWVFL